MDNNEKAKPMGQVIQIDEARIRDHLGGMVRVTVEDTLSAMERSTWLFRLPLPRLGVKHLRASN